MLNPIRTALARVHNVIPEFVLKAAFKSEEYMDVSIDELIMEKVIRARVLDDVSQRCGKIKSIVLQLSWVKYTSPPSQFTLAVSGAYSTFHIPPEARDFKDILCILGVSFPYVLSGQGNSAVMSNCAVGGITASQLACAALQSQTKAGLVSLPTAKLLPGNVVHLIPEGISWVPWVLRARLRFDDQFSGMNIDSIDSFNHVVEYAVKAYVYNTLLFEIESNLVHRGQELGVVKSVVDSYSDANDKYDEFLLALGGSSHFEPDRLRFLLSRMMPTI